MFDAFRRKQHETAEPDLIPVMNLMMTLIPFLLLGASFFHMAVIPTSTSQLTESDSDVPQTPKTVSLNLVIEADTLSLTASSTSLQPDELAGMAREFPVKAGAGADLDALQTHLLGIKKRYPESSTILVFPHDAIRYQQLVEILDRTRERVTPVSGREARREPLFPVTVFNKLVPPPAEPAPDDGAGAAADGQPGSEGAAVERAQEEGTFAPNNAAAPPERFPAPAQDDP